MIWLSRCFAAVRAHRVWVWIGFIAYACAVSFPHQNVQNVLGRFTDRFGREPLYQISVALALAEGFFLTVLFMLGLRAQKGRAWLVILWALCFAIMAGVWRLFMANNTELVHFPQYFPEGALLMALTLSPVESMAWIAFFGWLDEGYQYIFLTHGRITLLDFNDIYMDLIGGAAGILFAMVFLRSETVVQESWGEFGRRMLRLPGMVVAMSVLLAGGALLLSGKLLIYEAAGSPPHWFALSRLKTTSFWHSEPIVLGPHRFHELMPVEGIILIVVTILIFAPLERKLRFLAQPARVKPSPVGSAAIGS